MINAKTLQNAQEIKEITYHTKSIVRISKRLRDEGQVPMSLSNAVLELLTAIDELAGGIELQEADKDV